MLLERGERTRRIDALYVIRQGSLRAFERAPGGDALVRTIGPGELVDQLQTLAGGVRPVRIVASEASRLAVIDGDVVDALVASRAERGVHGLYFVIIGRLQTIRREPNGTLRTLGESSRISRGSPS